MFPSKHSEVAIAIRENTFLPANVRRIHTPPAWLARRGRALKLVRGDQAFLIMSLYLPPSPSNLREKQLWKWARRVLDETPSRRTRAFAGCQGSHLSKYMAKADREVQQQKKKTHSTASVWENSCRTTICKRRTHTSQWERLSFTNTQIDFACLPAAIHVHRCCALHHDREKDCNKQQPRREGIIAPFSVSFSIS